MPETTETTIVCTVCYAPVSNRRCLCDSVAESKGRTRAIDERLAHWAVDCSQHLPRKSFLGVIAAAVLTAASGCHEAIPLQQASFTVSFGTAPQKAEK